MQEEEFIKGGLQLCPQAAGRLFAGEKGRLVQPHSLKFNSKGEKMQI